MNGPMDSVLNNTNIPKNKLFTFENMDGVPPKMRVNFLNQISAEALVLFASQVGSLGPSTVVVNNYFRCVSRICRYTTEYLLIDMCLF